MNILSLHGVRSASLSPVQQKCTMPEPPFSGIRYAVQYISIEMDDGEKFMIELFMSQSHVIEETA